MNKADEQNEKYLPELCYSALLENGNLIIIKRNETGYYPCDYSTTDSEANRKLADKLNDRMGVSKAQEAAMVYGSIFGWHVPSADPSLYDDDGKPIKTQCFSPQSENVEIEGADEDDDEEEF